MFRSFIKNPWCWALFSSFLLLTLLSAHFIQDLDLGYHLRSGQWILKNHSVPTKDAYTYTVPDQDYVDSHWLYQIVLYLIYFVGSYSLLTLFNIILIIAVFSVLWVRLQLTGAPFFMSTLLFAWAVWACEVRFQVRPDILSWMFMCGMLLILEQRAVRTRGFLFLLPVFQLFWANTEGLFILGWCLIAVFLVSATFHQHRIDSKLLRYSGLAIVLCLVNPYFFKGVLFPFKLWQTLHSDLIQPNITEFMSPWSHTNLQTMPDAQLWTYKLFGVLLLLLLLITFKKRKLYEIFLFIIFFYLSVIAVRNVPIFILTCLPTLASCWKDLEWSWLQKVQESFLFKTCAAWTLTALLIGLGLRVITNAYYLDDLRLDRFGLGVNNESQPMRAADFLVQNHLDGRILNSLNSGGWLDWEGKQKIFIDGRLEVMGEKLFAEYIAAQNPDKVVPLADKYSAEIIFFKITDSTQWIYDLQNNKNWRPVYVDGNCVIFLRKGYAPQVPALDDTQVMEVNNIKAQITNQASEILNLPIPTYWNSFWRGFYNPPAYPNEIVNVGTFFFVSNHPKTGEEFFLKALQISNGNYLDIYLKLGFFYYHFKQYAEACLCVDQVLKKDPTNPIARHIFESLPHG